MQPKPWTIYPSENSIEIEADDAGGDILIVAGVHGDEPCGWNAIYEFVNEDLSTLTKPVTFIVANKKAVRDNERYIDEDLNRLFGNQYDGSEDSHEKRLAKKLQSLVSSFDITVSLHSTQSTDEPFAIFGPPIHRKGIELLHRLSISKAVFTPKQNQHGSMVCLPNALEVECGRQHTDGAKENAKRVIKNAIAFIDGFSDRSPAAYTDVRLFELVDSIPKPDVSEVTLFVSNFELVEKDMLVAEFDDERFFAPKDFTPILMSENGYDEILGFHGNDLGWLSEAALFEHPTQEQYITKVETEM